MTYYYTGGGTPQSTASSKLFLATFLGGFPDGTTFVNITDGGYITNDDPYWRLGGSSGGSKQIEIGLWNNHIIDITVDGAIIPIEGTLSADNKYSGTVLEITHSVAFGLPVHVSGNNTGALADASSLADMPCIGLSVGTNKVLTHGTIKDTAWSWTANDKIYVSNTGTLITTPPATVGDIVQCIAVAISATELLVDRYDWVKRK